MIPTHSRLCMNGYRDTSVRNEGIITGMFQNIVALIWAAMGQIWPKISENRPKSQIFIAGHPQNVPLSTPTLCEWLEKLEIHQGILSFFEADIAQIGPIISK